MSRALPWVLALAALAAGLPHAAADAAAEARFWDGRAREAFDDHDYDRALALFLESYNAAPSPGALYNIGVAATLARQDGLAYTHFDEFLASRSTDEARRADARRRMEEMEARLSRVRVTSDPPGARITVDREELGEFGRTPRTIVVDPGAHSVTLTLDGHEARTAAIEVARGAAAAVDEVLPAILGVVTLEVAPAGVTTTVIAIDDRGTELTGEGSSLALPFGHHRIRVSAAGFRDRELDAVASATPVVLRVSLEPLPPVTGRLLVDTAGVAARLSVDGTARATTPAAIELEVGVHVVRVEAEGHAPWEGSVEIEAGHARFVDLVLVSTEGP